MLQYSVKHIAFQAECDSQDGVFMQRYIATLTTS